MSSDQDREIQKPLAKNKKKSGDSNSDQEDEKSNDNDVDYGFKPEEIEKIFNKRNFDELKKVGSAEQIAAALNSSLEGLKSDNVEASIDYFGDNIPQEKEPISIQDLILECFEDPVLRILLVATLVSLVVGISTDGLAEGWFESAAIFVAVGIIVVVTTTNNYMKQMKFRELYAKADERDVSVTRDGKTMQIHINDLVVGDVMYFQTGEHFCIDGVMVRGHSVKCDESAMTGQSDLIKKDTYDNCLNITQTGGGHDNIQPFLISGTKVMEGNGQVLVMAVGQNTVYNKIRELTQQEKDDTPLQLKLADLADDIGKVGMICALMTVLAASIHLIYDRSQEHHEGDPSIWNMELAQELLDFLILGITIIVVAVPEGLPLAVTIALAYSSQKMYEEKNFVRFLAACETMGGADNICSDKTGTLTLNLMTVTNIYVGGQSTDKITKKCFDAQTNQLLCEGICLNSSALPKIEKNGDVDQNGNKTECALLQFAYDQGYDYRDKRGPKVSQKQKEKLFRVVPFSSKIKMMSCCYQFKPNGARVYVKGAPDYLLDNCSKYYDESGEKEFTQEFRKKVDDAILAYADKSLRTLLLAYKEVSKKQAAECSEEQLTKNITFLGIVGIKDPLRQQIPEAIKKCQQAGITVRMITGDRRQTALAIAKDAGIIDTQFQITESTKYTVMEGEQFEQFVGGKKKNKNGDEVVGNLDNMKIIDKQLRILARSRPEDKYLMVLGLKQLHHVVAVTGDGTNDAPALKKADIGFAMGIAGTKVAQEASGIVLLDDNFASIITSIKWGRNVFECIRQFLQFQLSVNFVAMFMAFLGGVVLRESPLNAIEMLWVNLIMDTFASLALATESPSEQLLTRKPYSKYEYMITPNMFRNFVMMGFFQCIFLSYILFYGDVTFGVPSGRQNPKWTVENGKHYTLFFNIFVYLQVFNQINARKLKRDQLNIFEGFFNNPIFPIVLLITVVIQTILVQFGGYAVKMVPLSVNEHLTCIVLGMLSMVFGYIIQIIPEGFYTNFELFTKQREFDRAQEEQKEKEREKQRLKKEAEQLKKIKKLQNKGQRDGSDGEQDEGDDDDEEGEDQKEDSYDKKSQRSSFFEKPASYRHQAKKHAQEAHEQEHLQQSLEQQKTVELNNQKQEESDNQKSSSRQQIELQMQEKSSPQEQKEKSSPKEQQGKEEKSKQDKEKSQQQK